MIERTLISFRQFSLRSIDCKIGHFSQADATRLRKEFLNFLLARKFRLANQILISAKSDISEKLQWQRPRSLILGIDEAGPENDGIQFIHYTCIPEQKTLGFSLHFAIFRKHWHNCFGSAEEYEVLFLICGLRQYSGNINTRISIQAFMRLFVHGCRYGVLPLVDLIE